MKKSHSIAGIASTILLFVFTLSHAQEWNELTRIIASDGASGDYFGYSVSISGNNLIVGARGDDDNGMNSGAAYVFENDSPEIFADGFESGDLSAWQGSR